MENSSNGSDYSEAISNRIKMVGDLVNEIDLKTGNQDRLQLKYNKKILSLIKMLEEKDELHRSCCEETTKLQLVAQEHIKWVSDEQEWLNLELEYKEKMLDLRSRKLDNREASMESKREKIEAQRKLCTKEHTSDDVSEAAEIKEQLESDDESEAAEIKEQLESDDESEDESETAEIKEQLKEKEDHIEAQEELIKDLITKEREANDELQKARNTLIVELGDILGSTRANIRIKQLGEIDCKAFKDACQSRFQSCVVDIKAAEFISSWKLQIQDPKWRPFRVVQDKTGKKEIKIKEDDELLQKLHKEWGEDVYKAVATALMELETYNASGRSVVPELWNFKENRKATLKEVISYLLALVKTLKWKQILTGECMLEP